VAEEVVIEGLSKVYPGGGLALDDLSLRVEPGTFLVLLGPSGSGKTTLLRCIAGIERASSGRITIGETLVADGARHVPPERRGLSMVFQDYALWPHLAARDNVAFALRRLGLGRAECREQAAAMLERVGLGALAHRYPSQLSGGEQQRVALARALVAQMGLVLCDEPLSNLDADLRERMRVEISALVRASGATTVYITHDQVEAFALADRVGVLEQGRLVQLGRPEEVYTAPVSAFVARFTGLAGEFGVRILGRVGDNGSVEVESRELGFAHPLRARTLLPDPLPERALLAVRPTAVAICAPDGDGHQLRGTVADVAFRDRGYEHAVDVPGAARITSVLAEARVARGEAVGLRFDPAGCLVFPLEEAD
jgi:iron(III) transport system ATP-binding protein